MCGAYSTHPRLAFTATGPDTPVSCLQRRKTDRNRFQLGHLLLNHSLPIMDLFSQRFASLMVITTLPWQHFLKWRDCCWLYRKLSCNVFLSKLRHDLCWEQFFAKWLRRKHKAAALSFQQVSSGFDVSDYTTTRAGVPLLTERTDPSDWLIRTKADKNSSPFSGGTEKYFFEVGGSVGFVPIGPQSLSRLSFMVEGLK